MGVSRLRGNIWDVLDRLWGIVSRLIYILCLESFFKFADGGRF